MRVPVICVLFGAVFNPGAVLAQADERGRLREEIRKYEDELVELNRIVPNTPRPRAMSPAIAKSREREQLAFNGWASSNDPLLHAAIMKGTGLNAMLRVLGPVAHYRRMRSERNAEIVFPSLKPDHSILPTDVSPLHLVPASAVGSNGAIRPNHLPLDLQWPTAILQNWSADTKDILKLKDRFVAALSSESAIDVHVVIDRAEVLDSALELMQLKVIQKRRTVPTDSSLTTQKRNQVYRDLQVALRYLESLRATVDRFKNSPGEYKVSRFDGGSIEDFLDFCYLRGMVFQEAQPADREHYQKMFRRMQDYAYDVQFVEDWKSDLEQRLGELSLTERQLLWRGTELNEQRSIAGKWWNGLDGDGRQMMTITQKGDDITVTCSYNRPGFGEITWRLTGAVSKEGQITGRLEHTKAPKGYQNQNHSAKVSPDGNTITGTAILDGGGVADYVWTLVKENGPK